MTLRHLFILLLLTTGFLTSCGFKPMYSDNSGNDTYTLLPEIQIGTLSSSQRYKLHNYLEDELDPNNESTDKRFTLDVIVTDTISDLLVQKDSTITKKQHHVSASYVLKAKHNKKTIDQGTINMTASFSELPSEYATYAISEKTFDNALKDIASTLKKRLIIALMKYQKTNHENQPS